MALRPSKFDDPGPSREGRLDSSLARIADALGLPTSHFYTTASDKVQADRQTKLTDTAILTLVRSYLQVAHPDARRKFVEAVTTIADELSS